MKNVLLNVAFLVFEIILMLVLNWFLIWVLDNFIFDLLNWFNHLNVFLKVVLIFIGGAGLIYLILGILKGVFILITQPVFNRMPVNTFTGTVAFVVFLLNTIVLLYQMWHVVPELSFWTIIELIMLSFIIISLNWSVLADRRKVQTQAN